MFTFKKFVVKQDNSAMKVCTDACLFGALINHNQAKNALDIGTGTGLLSLMVAQRHAELSIDAVEIDKGASLDAFENFSNSPFSSQISLYNQTIQSFTTDKKYDLIFSNPPFYNNQLKSSEEKKNVAHHSSQLSFAELLNVSAQYLNTKGSLWILLPPFEMNIFKEEAKILGFKPKTTFKVKHNSNKPVFREIVEFRKTEDFSEDLTEILIYENDKYSSNFTEFLKDYYLIF